MLTMLPIDSIVPAEDNLRRRIGDVRDLAASITAVGIVEPLLVSPVDDGRYVIVAGHRRHAAAQKAGMTEVPCTIRTLTDVERVEIMLVENLQRADLTAIEEASGYFRLVEHGMTQKELARRIGRSARHVASRLALLELPRNVQDELQSGAMTVSDGQALLTFRDQPEIIERLVADEWNRRDIERAVLREQHRIEAAKVNAERRTAANPRPEPGEGEGDGSGNGAHGQQATSQDKGVDRLDPQADERAKAKARTAASNSRIEFARALLGRKLPKADVWSLVAVQVVGDLSATHAKLICRILGIEPLEGRFAPDHRAAVEAHSAASTADRDRALLAAAIAIGEETAHYASTTEAARRHLEFLATYGFDPEADDPTNR
jgi:ParB/RepB/Spo0J family partition protein